MTAGGGGGWLVSGGVEGVGVFFFFFSILTFFFLCLLVLYFVIRIFLAFCIFVSVSLRFWLNPVDLGKFSRGGRSSTKVFVFPKQFYCGGFSLTEINLCFFWVECDFGAFLVLSFVSLGFD